ncbi:MAG: ribokinase [Acidimicrobiia bacterium]|nr:ribokinase [Acidimicrobiia bacterium]
MTERIVVVGSINRDVVLGVEQLPIPGETVLGRSLGTYNGGKGANQAVAAARLGRSVAMVGRVGDDRAGVASREALTAEGIDARGVRVDRKAVTGSAMILVDDDGENSIVVVPGANGRLSAKDVVACSDAIGAAAVTLVQLEVPMEAVAEAVRLSRGTVVLNAAPARPIPAEVMRAVDVIVVNRSELAGLCADLEAESTKEIASQVERLRCPGAVVVTVGSDGAMVVDNGDIVHVPAVNVAVVDTTGAGDAFCGAVADALAGGDTLERAVGWAVLVGAAAATKVGAQVALPTRSEVKAMLKR